jgi:hypothetical protein
VWLEQLIDIWPRLRPLMRDISHVLMFALGFYIAIHEAVLTAGPADLQVLVLAAGLMGLVGIFRA